MRIVIVAALAGCSSNPAPPADRPQPVPALAADAATAPDVALVPDAATADVPAIPDYAKRKPAPVLKLEPRTLTTEQCRTEATALAKFLADTPHEKHVFLAQRGSALVHRTDLKAVPTPPAPILNVSNAELSFQGRRIDSGALAKELGKPRAERRLYLRIEPAVTWSIVVEVVRVATTATWKPAFAFRIDAPVTPPPPSGIDDALAKALRGEVDLAAIREAVLDPCPTLAPLFEVREGAAGQTTKQIVDGVGKALIACTCSTDLAALRTLLWRLVVEETTASVIAFDGAATDKLALPADTTWEVASKQLVPGKSYQLAVQ